MSEETNNDFAFDAMPFLDLSLFDGTGTRDLASTEASACTSHASFSPVSLHTIQDAEAIINDPKDPRGIVGGASTLPL